MVDSCKSGSVSFCLDCGDPKAAYDSVSFSEIPKKISSSYNISNAKGGIMFQVLVDSIGYGCVISHTDVSNNKITQDIVRYLNACKWIPAREGKKKTVRSSITVLFRFSQGTISGSIQRVNNNDLNANMKNPGEPKVYNKAYKYDNPSLSSYDITVWQKENSDLPQDMSQHSVVDKNDIVWYVTFNGMAKFDGKNFTRLDENNSPFKVKENIEAIAIDKDNNKWFCGYNGGVYKFDNKYWEKFDSTKVGVKSVYNIVCTNNGEVLFCDDKGLSIYKDGAYQLLNDKKIKELPSNRVDYAYRDQQNRLWIGTFSGSIMIDKDQKVTSYNDSDTPVKGTCITAATEDEAGNLYFALYDYTRSKVRDREKEGFVKLSKNGIWTHYNDLNSGLPANTINSLFYDKFENVLWIGTNEAGLARFDLKDGWEVYNNANSKVPSTLIFHISQDSKGSLYVSTYDGMMRITKK